MLKKILGMLSLVLLVSCGDSSIGFKKTGNITQGEEKAKIAIKTLKIKELNTPESVVAYGENVYVSNLGGAPFESLKKGFITKFEQGKSNKLFEGLLDDPKGFVFLNEDTILVSDQPNVKILKISTGEVVFTLPIGGAGFLNDLVLVNKQVALLTDTGTGLIHKITVNAELNSIVSSIVEGVSENGINGIAHHVPTNKIYFITSTFGGDSTRGHIFEASFSDDFSSIKNLEKWELTQQGSGGLDGIAFLKKGEKTYLVISDWGKDNVSNIFGYNIENRILEFTIDGDIGGVADISIDETGKLYLPEFTKGSVRVVELEKLVK